MCHSWPLENLLIGLRMQLTRLKLLLAAWARYEEEDFPSRDQIYEIRQEWGKMAKNFIQKED